ncbi:MAG: hypothetical protein ACK6D3_16710 [Planctomycetaceae bacterium]
MLSSTSNSNERLPEIPWGRTWGLALSLLVLLCLGYEGFWRARGFRSSVTDDMALWAKVLHSIPARSPDATVALGASRIRLGLDTDELQRGFNQRKPYQLAVAGSLCLPVLRHLVDETGFAGLILYDVHPGSICGTPFFGTPLAQAEYLQQAQQLSAVSDLDVELRTRLDQLLVSRRSDLTIKSVLVHLLEKKALPICTRWVQADRRMLADYSTFVSVEPEVESATRLPSSQEVFEERFQELARLVDKLRARGGEIFFVRMPSSGQKLEREERLFPRELEWDQIVRRLDAAAFHFADDERTAGLKVPDQGHLDYRDSTRFTEVLAEKMRASQRLRKYLSDLP